MGETDIKRLIPPPGVTTGERYSKVLIQLWHQNMIAKEFILIKKKKKFFFFF